MSEWTVKTIEIDEWLETGGQMFVPATGEEVEEHFRQYIAREPARKHHLSLTYSELCAFRRVADLDELSEFDKVFFERHGTAASFERPPYPCEFPPVYDRPGMAGVVVVTYITGYLRVRRVQCFVVGLS